MERAVPAEPAGQHIPRGRCYESVVTDDSDEMRSARLSTVLAAVLLPLLLAGLTPGAGAWRCVVASNAR